MTRDEVELRLKQIGFEIRKNHPESTYASIWLNDEEVGDLNKYEMSMFKYTLSVVIKAGLSIERRYFVYEEIADMNVLEDLKRDLLDSANRWYEELRRERVKNVKAYFKKKQEVSFEDGIR
jgi:hypothetical protein